MECEYLEKVQLSSVMGSEIVLIPSKTSAMQSVNCHMFQIFKRTKKSSVTSMTVTVTVLHWALQWVRPRHSLCCILTGKYVQNMLSFFFLYIKPRLTCGWSGNL